MKRRPKVYSNVSACHLDEWKWLSMIASLINLFTMRVLALDCFVKKVQLWYNNYTVRLVSKMNMKNTYSSRGNEHISWVERYLNVPLSKWGACSVTAGHGSLWEGKLSERNSRSAIPHAQQKLQCFYLNHSTEGTWSVSTFPASDLMWPKPHVGFPCGWEQMCARLCRVGSGIVVPCPRLLLCMALSWFGIVEPTGLCI